MPFTGADDGLIGVISFTFDSPLTERARERERPHKPMLAEWTSEILSLSPLIQPALAYEDASLLKKVLYSRREARIDLCDFLLQNTTEFF